MGILKKFSSAVMEKLGYIKSDRQVIRLLSDVWDRDYGIEAPSTLEDYLDQYGESAWVYVCANRIAKKCSSITFKLYNNKKDGDKEEINSHIFLDVLQKPNDKMSELELRFLLHLHMELAGEAFWYIPRNNAGGPFQIIPLMPDKMTVVPGAEKLVKGYIYKVGSDTLAFEPWEIVHFAYPNPDPDNFFRGASPIKAATYAIATNQNAEMWNYRFFKNGAVPQGYLSTDKRLDNPEAERLRRLWERHHKGEKQWHKLAIAQQGLEYKHSGIGHQDMDFVNQLEMTRDTILSIYGVPKSIIGIIEDVNRANGFQDELNFATYTVKPILDFVASELNAHLLPQWDESLSCGFENVIPRDQEFLLKKHETYLKHYVYTINDVREELGKEPVPWGDVPYAPMSVMPLTSDDKNSDDNDKTFEFLSGINPGINSQKKTRLTAYEKKVSRNISRLFDTKAKKDKEWELYVQRLTKRERKFKSPLLKYFQKLQDEINQKLKDILSDEKQLKHALIEEIIYNEEDKAKELRPVMYSAIAGSIKDEAEFLISQLELEFIFDNADPQVINWIKTRADRFSFEVTKTTAEQLRTTLNAGVEAGETLPQLTDRVNQVFRDKKTWEAERIARTEMASASSYGRQATFEQSKIIDEKEWLAAGDERSRESHLITGQAVKKKEDFILGSGVTTPGPGMSGVAGEDINCRCMSLPRISKMED